MSGMRMGRGIKMNGDMDKVIAAIRIAIIKAKADIEIHAKRLCPVDTGRLRASIETEITEDRIFLRANTEYACVYGAYTPVYEPIEHTSHTIGNYPSKYIMSKDGKPHKIIKRHRFYQKKMNLVKITAHTRRNPLIVTENHLILILRDKNLIWEEAKNLTTDDYIFTKRANNADTHDSNKTSFTCVCGEEFKVNNSILKFRNPKYCSLSCRHEYGRHDLAKGKRWKLSEDKKIHYQGINNSQWRGGISKLPYDWRFNKSLKRKIKNRDNNACKICSSSIDLIIHHRDKNKTNSDENNLVTLCRRCHAHVTHGKLDCELPEVNLDVFKPRKIMGIKKMTKIRDGAKNIGRIYDFTIDGENSYYAAGILIHNSYVEFGTLKMNPQPFIRPALHAGVRKYLPERIRAELGRLA